MDLLESLKASVLPEWVKIPGIDAELNILRLTTTEMQRLSTKATRRNKINRTLLLELTYPKVLKGFRGLTLGALAEKYNIKVEDKTTYNGNSYTKTDVINVDPIDQHWLDFFILLGKIRPQFHYWINEVCGNSAIVDDEELEED